MHDSLNGFALFFVLPEDVIEPVEIHDIVLMEVDSAIEFLRRDGVG